MPSLMGLTTIQGRRAREITERELKALARAVRFYGGWRGLAAAMGVSDQAVRNWVRHGIPAHQVTPISRATGIPKAALRPDLFSSRRG